MEEKAFILNVLNLLKMNLKSISPWITGGVKRPPIHGEIEKLTKTVEAYEKQMEGYHH